MISLARFVIAHRWWVLAAWPLLTVAGGYAAPKAISALTYDFVLGEGSAIAYWYQVIAVGTAAVWAGPFRGWMRGCRQPPIFVRGQVAAHADPAPAAQLATVNMRRRDSAIPPV